ncbi:hypothetical protein QFC22_001308 [Naganishia vaughanmartiniae]|uniref:Uncharacterized protein n=1 Tax=Naganishia vaughanmartiniae TaxID=1424756 RepID=A0ACC2XIL5_9TREE|nr:hypothetical protein QFC22_001308 [Naganishia vaughanmartiniae]
MAYPLQTLYGPCPYDHPYRIPAIQFEWTHKVGEVLPAGKSFKDHLIWSSGETTGYGFHADFTMGWDRDVLTKALNDPACLLGKSIPAEECPSLGINKEVDIAKARACKPAHGYVEEAGTTFGETVDRLPGCNLPWKSGPKPTCSQQSPDPNIQSFIGITADSVAVPVDREVKPAGAPKDVWERVGCLDEYVLDLGNKTGWHDYNSMTNERCHDFCAEIGAPYAGTYQGSRCRCALTMNTASYLLDDKKCAEKCSGDSSNCGGMGYNLYHNSFVAIQGPKQPKESDKSYRGCFTDGSIVGQRSPAHENVDTCRAHCKGFKYYGIAAGKYCDCSNEILAPQGIETRVPDYLCSSPCDTKPEQMCGGEPYGTFYQSVYIVDGTFQPKPAANVASTGFSSVPTTSGGSVETGPAVVGNGVLLAVATTSSASVATSTTRNVATPKLPGVNNMAIDLKDELGSKAGSVIAQSTDAPTRASSSHRQHHHTPCAVVTKTVTVTATVKASDAGKRHVQRRSRQHMFDFLS